MQMPHVFSPQRRQHHRTPEQLAAQRPQKYDGDVPHDHRVGWPAEHVASSIELLVGGALDSLNTLWKFARLTSGQVAITMQVFSSR
mmetsp:Transcript_29233/g.66186  ORF Transcript_29233/g.66186 Transcript_29233/m.66186 type:complete len:86 (-) Transcript_29233:557-814(-)